jgi:hypothetical protein
MCAILSLEDVQGYGNDPSNLRLCDTGANNIGTSTKNQREKGTLQTQIMAQHTSVTKGS